MAQKYSTWAINLAILFCVLVTLCVPAGFQALWNLAVAIPFDLPKMTYLQAVFGCAFILFFTSFFKRRG